MDKIVNILMQRDGITELEAHIMLDNASAEIDEAIMYGAGIEEVEDIVRYNLGLEPDYLDELLLGL